jgi:hypothetical protein
MSRIAACCRGLVPSAATWRSKISPPPCTRHGRLRSSGCRQRLREQPDRGRRPTAAASFNFDDEKRALTALTVFSALGSINDFITKSWGNPSPRLRFAHRAFTSAAARLLLATAKSPRSILCAFGRVRRRNVDMAYERSPNEKAISDSSGKGTEIVAASAAPTDYQSALFADHRIGSERSTPASKACLRTRPPKPEKGNQSARLFSHPD